MHNDKKLLTAIAIGMLGLLLASYTWTDYLVNYVIIDNQPTAPDDKPTIGVGDSDTTIIIGENGTSGSGASDGKSEGVNPSNPGDSENPSEPVKPTEPGTDPETPGPEPKIHAFTSWSTNYLIPGGESESYLTIINESEYEVSLDIRFGVMSSTIEESENVLITYGLGKERNETKELNTTFETLNVKLKPGKKIVYYVNIGLDVKADNKYQNTNFDIQFDVSMSDLN